MGLIVFYVMLVLVNIVIDDGSCTSGYGLIKAVLYLKYIELGILGIFIIEILIKAVAMGMQVRLIILDFQKTKIWFLI